MKRLNFIKFIILIGIFFLSQVITSVNAGESSSTYNQSYGEIKLSVQFDDEFVMFTQDGQVTVKFEVIDLQCEKIVITQVSVNLVEGTSSGGRSQGFTNPSWKSADSEHVFRSRGLQSWKFNPFTELRSVPIGLAWITVSIHWRSYTTISDYEYWEWITEPADTTVQVIDAPVEITTDDSSSIPGFGMFMVLFTIPFVIGIRKLRE